MCKAGLGLFAGICTDPLRRLTNWRKEKKSWLFVLPAAAASLPAV